MKKTIKTTFQTRIDEFDNWINKNPVLAKGEIVIVKKTINDNTICLFRVGDGVSTFSELPFSYGMAADVYNWAKKADRPVYTYGDTDLINVEQKGSAENVKQQLLSLFPTIGSLDDTDQPKLKSISYTSEANIPETPSENIEYALTDLINSGDLDLELQTTINMIPNKVDILETDDYRLYAHSPDGEGSVLFSNTAEPVADAIASYTSTGTLKVNDATTDSEAVNLKQVTDGWVKTHTRATGDYDLLYGQNNSGNIMFKARSTPENYAIPTFGDKGTLKTRTPTANNDCVNLQYFNENLPTVAHFDLGYSQIEESDLPNSWNDTYYIDDSLTKKQAMMSSSWIKWYPDGSGISQTEFDTLINKGKIIAVSIIGYGNLITESQVLTEKNADNYDVDSLINSNSGIYIMKRDDRTHYIITNTKSSSIYGWKASITIIC